MSFIYSRALVEASSPVKCSGIDVFVPSNGSPTPKPSSSQDKTTAHFRLSRFGMTCEPLTESRGAALLTWWLAGFPAKTSALQEKAQASTGNDLACGVTWRGSLARFDPDSSLWKTAQPSLLGDSEECSVIWPRSGMTAGGQCWELPMLGRRINATGSGLWVPTPCATDAGSGRMNTSIGSSNPRPMLALMARKNLWPTPTICGNHNRKGASATSGDGLATAVLAHTAVVGGQLNPKWVEWLIGWPIGHTDLKRSETAKSQSAPPSHLKCSPISLSEAA